MSKRREASERERVPEEVARALAHISAFPPAVELDSGELVTWDEYERRRNAPTEQHPSEG